MLEALAEAIALVRGFLDERGAALDEVIRETGLPTESYQDTEVEAKTAEVFQHIHRVYPTGPSPCYEVAA